jgi:protein-glutamine gamma-glutamyltransferase
MKPPPLLLGAALVFWGWQSDFLIPGVAMALIVEAARFTKTRWDLSDEDFSRVWTFCSLIFLAASVYAFTSNSGPANFGGWLQNPGFRTQGAAGLSTARTAASMFRWLPMIFFPFLAAQLYSTRETIPLTTISLILQRRWKKAKRAGKPLPPARDVDIGFPFLAGTLLAASVHPSDDTSFFWGMAALLAWALWPQRSRRFGLIMWFGALAVALTLGYGGQRGFGLLQRYVVGLNAEWLANFMRRNFDPAQTRTALGQVGSVKTSGRIVIRLETKNGLRVPAYLREASYRLYKSPAWMAGSSKEVFQGVTEEPPANSGNWTLLAGKTNTRTINIACYLEGAKGSSPAGLLPLPAGVGRMKKLPAYVLSYNTAGAVLVEGPGLLIFDAFYNPDSTLDSPPGTGSTNQGNSAVSPPFDSGDANSPPAGLTNKGAPRNEDLQVPEREKPALDRMIDELKLRGLPRGETLRKVAGFFADKFTYRTWQPPGRISTNETYMSRFLLKTRAGHCEYFATATTLLLRRLEIPTRYAVGYAVHEPSGSGYVVRLRDAHAWCLVWNPDKKLWYDFDTTPASWFAEEERLASAFQWLQDAWTRLKFELAKIRWGQSNLRLYLLIGIVPGLAVLFYQIVFRRGRRRKKAGDGKLAEVFDWPGLDSEFYQLEKKLAERGVPREPGEALFDWLERVVVSPGLAELSAPLQEILRLHYRYRFDPLGLGEADREVLRHETRACLDTLARTEHRVVK